MRRERIVPRRPCAFACGGGRKAEPDESVGIFFAFAEIDRRERCLDQFRQAIRHFRAGRLALNPLLSVPMRLRILVLAFLVDVLAYPRVRCAGRVAINVFGDETPGFSAVAAAALGLRLLLGRRRNVPIRGREAPAFEKNLTFDLRTCGQAHGKRGELQQAAAAFGLVVVPAVLLTIEGAPCVIIETPFERLWLLARRHAPKFFACPFKVWRKVDGGAHTRLTLERRRPLKRLATAAKRAMLEGSRL